LAYCESAKATATKAARAIATETCKNKKKLIKEILEKVVTVAFFVPLVILS